MNEGKKSPKYRKRAPRKKGRIYLKRSKPTTFAAGRGRRPYQEPKESSFPRNITPPESRSLVILTKYPRRTVSSGLLRAREERRGARTQKKLLINKWIEKLGIPRLTLVPVWGGHYEGEVQARVKNLWKYKRSVINATFIKLQKELKLGGQFLKTCAKCAKEIPMASEECQYCRAKQPEWRKHE